MLTIPPQTVAGEQDPSNVEDAVADIEAKLPGLLRYMDPSDPGMHATDTIDFEVVLEGTVLLELDDGAEVTLNAGDTVVQNGTSTAGRTRVTSRLGWLSSSAVPTIPPFPPAD